MLIVQKYGGTSVGDIERIRAVARKVKRVCDEGHQVVLVVSAMSGETDKLIGLAEELSNHIEGREMDLLLSSGERISAALMAMAISELGVKSMSFTGRQVGIVTNDAHTKARIEKVSANRLKKALAEGAVPVVTGFQGISVTGKDVTTFGRGGSDLTAVAIAASLKAALCEIYTDVDGVYTTDPNMVTEARKLDRVSYEEMLEFSSLGAKVLQSMAVEYAKKYNVPLVVRSSFSDAPGTLIVKEDEDMEKVVVSGVAYDKNQSKITIIGVPDRPGIASKLFGTVAAANIVVDMIVQNISHATGATDISFTVARTESKKAMKLADSLAKDLDAVGTDLREDISKVSIVGVGMKSHSGVAALMFETLAKHGVNIMMISTSEIKVSCVIEKKFTELAVRALHNAFGLEGKKKPAKKKTAKKKAKAKRG